jgi:ElaB/YqjD/DUF883 family membrane-anchored ribosome-binding protein
MSENQENNQAEVTNNEEHLEIPASWEEYVASLPEDQQEVVSKLYSAKNQALLNAVKATREERDALATQLREAAKKAEKGSEAEKLYTEQADQLEKANKRANFYEDAPNNGCRNAKAAFKIALADNLFKENGSPDWEAIRAEAPELFGSLMSTSKKPVGKAGAGEGTDKKPVSALGMSDLIRQQAGIASNFFEE